MPRISNLPLVGLLLLMASCNSSRKPSAENFTQAINQYLDQHGKTCTLISRQFPIDIPASAQQTQYGFGPQLLALQHAGLVSETDTTAVVHTMLDPLRGTTPPQPVRQYQLTAEGQKYFQQVPGSFGPTGSLCYGQKSVDSILDWSNPVNTGDSSQTEVTYKYKFVNLAAWANQTEIQRKFPDIASEVNGASKTNQKIGLQLTNDGWKVLGF